MTNRFFAIRPHDTGPVAFSNLSTLESVSKSLRFNRKRYVVFIVFVWTGNATKCLRFQMKTHPCGRGLGFSLVSNFTLLFPIPFTLR